MKAGTRRLTGVFALALFELLPFAGVGTLLSGTAGFAQSQSQQRENSAETFEQLASRARTAMATDRIPEAIRLYTLATKMRPYWSEGWWHLGTLFFDSGRFHEAEGAFSNFVAVEKEQPGPGFAMLGLSQFHLKEYANALAALERGRRLGLGANPDFVHSVLYHDGILSNFLGQPEVALQRLTLVANQMAAANPAAPKDAVLGDLELLDAFGLAALRMPKLPSGVPREEAALVRSAGHAQALIALQDRVAAEAELKELSSAFQSESGVHYFYGVFLLKEHPPLAMEEFRHEIEVTPSHYAARIQLAFEFLNNADYTQGLKYAREAVALAPGNFAAHVACGRLWLATGNTNQAIRELQTAVKLAAGSPDAHFALSRALAQAGRRTEAARERAEFERLKTLADQANR